MVFVLAKSEAAKKAGVKTGWTTPLRAVCVRAISLVSQGQPEQLDLFTDMLYLDRLNKLDLAIEEIRRRCEKRAVYAACLMVRLDDAGRGA